MQNHTETIQEQCKSHTNKRQKPRKNIQTPYKINAETISKCAETIQKPCRNHAKTMQQPCSNHKEAMQKQSKNHAKTIQKQSVRDT